MFGKQPTILVDLAELVGCTPPITGPLADPLRYIGT